MAVIRTVFMPLSREPEVLFGLKLSDLIWPTISSLTSLAVWHADKLGLSARLTVITMTMATGLVLAKARIEEASLPQWAMRFLLFWTRTRLYLP
jgi:hypothetical protein